MDENIYPHWPEVDAETLRAIGQFVVAWGVLETQISDAIGDVYGLEHTAGLSITANLGTKAKLELFMSGIALYEDLLPPSVDIRDVNKMATDTGDLANQYRNLVAHGQPIPFNFQGDTDEMFPKYDWTWVRFSARKGGVKMTAYKLTQHPFETAIVETIKVIDQWTQFRMDSAQQLRFGHDATR